MSGFSVGANCFLSSPNLVKTMGPNPTTVRGASVPVNMHPKENRIIYPSGKFIVVRSLDDPNDCFIYRGHAHPTTVAKFSVNGFWVASADISGKVRVWAWDNPEHLTKLETSVFAGSVLDLDWDSESKKIVAVGEGSGIMAKVFTWDTGNSVGEMVGHNKRILSVAFKLTRPFRIATASEDMRTIFYTGPPFKLDHSNSTHTNFVNCLRYAPDGSKFVSVGSDKKIQVYNGANGEPTGDIVDAHAGGIYSVCFSPDSTKFATASADKTIKVWDANTLANEATLTLSADPQIGDMQVSVCWLRNGQILSVSLNGNINIFDLATPTAPVRIIEAHQVSITAMTLDSATGRLYTGSYDGVVCVRDLAANGPATKLIGTDKRSTCNAVHGGKLSGMVFTADECASIGWDDTLRFASSATNQYFEGLPLNGQPVALASSPLVPGLLVVVTNTEIALYRDRTLVNTLRNHGYGGLCAALWGAEELAIGGDDSKTHIYNIADNNFTPAGVVTTRSPVTCLAYNPQGDCLAIGDTGRQVEIYDRGTWAPRIVGRWVFHTSKITALSWSPSGAQLASGSLDESIIIWSLATPEKMSQFQFAHSGGVTGLAWLADDQLVSAGSDHVVAQWRI